jgi:hypothetical protein
MLSVANKPECLNAECRSALNMAHEAGASKLMIFSLLPLSNICGQ